MKPDTVQAVAEALRRAGRRRALLSYPKFHLLFDCDDPLRNRYAALAEAVRLLADSRPIDYGVLLARDNGLPGDEFFERFRRTRPEEYAAVMGTNTYRQSIKLKRTLVANERERVYDDARRVEPVANCA